MRWLPVAIAVMALLSVAAIGVYFAGHLEIAGVVCLYGLAPVSALLLAILECQRRQWDSSAKVHPVL